MVDDFFRLDGGNPVIKEEALIIVSATPGHFREARQKLALAQTACRVSKNTPARRACFTGLAETMIMA